MGFPTPRPQLSRTCFLGDEAETPLRMLEAPGPSAGVPAEDSSLHASRAPPRAAAGVLGFVTVRHADRRTEGNASWLPAITSPCPHSDTQAQTLHTHVQENRNAAPDTDIYTHRCPGRQTQGAGAQTTRDLQTRRHHSTTQTHGHARQLTSKPTRTLTHAVPCSPLLSCLPGK